MLYIKLGLMVGDHKELINVPVMDMTENGNIRFGNLKDNFTSYDNISSLGVEKGYIFIPDAEHYFEPVKIEDSVIPIIEPGQYDRDVTGLYYNYLGVLMSLGLPLIICDKIGFSVDQGRYVSTETNKTITDYMEQYKMIVRSDESFESKDEQDVDSEYTPSTNTYKEDLETEYVEVISTLVFSNYANLSNNYNLSNFIFYDRERRGMIDTSSPDEEINYLSQKYKWLASIALYLNGYGSINEPNFSQEGYRYFMGGLRNPSPQPLNILEYSKWNLNINLISLLESCFEFTTSVTKNLSVTTRNSINEEQVNSIKFRINGNTRLKLLPTMTKCTDTLKLPIAPMHEIVDINNEVLSNYSSLTNLDINSEIIERNILSTLDYELEFKQEDFAFPYTNASMYSENFRYLHEKGMISDEEYKLLLGSDDLVEDDNKVYDSENEVMYSILQLHSDLLYYEHGDKYDVPRENFLQFCENEGLRSNMFLYYMTILCCKVANITYSFTGTFYNKPSEVWFTELGYKLKNSGKSYKDECIMDKTKMVYDESYYTRFSESSNYRITNVMKQGSFLGSADEVLFGALKRAYKNKLHAPMLVLLRLARFGERRPSLIKIDDGVYFDPIRVTIRDYIGSTKDLKDVKINGYDGENPVIHFINVDNDLYEYDVQHSKAGAEVPLYVTYEQYKEHGQKISKTVDIITLVRDLNIKGLNAPILNTQESSSYELLREGILFKDSDISKFLNDVLNPNFDFTPFTLNSIGLLLNRDIRSGDLNSVIDSITINDCKNLFDVNNIDSINQTKLYSVKVVKETLTKLIPFIENKAYLMSTNKDKFKLLCDYVRKQDIKYELDNSSIKMSDEQSNIINNAVSSPFEDKKEKPLNPFEGETFKPLDIKPLDSEEKSQPSEQNKDFIPLDTEEKKDKRLDISGNQFDLNFVNEFDDDEEYKIPLGENRDYSNIVRTTVFKMDSSVWALIEYKDGNLEITTIPNKDSLDKFKSKLSDESSLKRINKSQPVYTAMCIIQCINRGNKLLYDDNIDIDRFNKDLQVKLNNMYVFLDKLFDLKMLAKKEVMSGNLPNDKAFEKLGEYVLNN